jgi:FRG domain
LNALARRSLTSAPFVDEWPTPGSGCSAARAASRPAGPRGCRPNARWCSGLVQPPRPWAFVRARLELGQRFRSTTREAIHAAPAPPCPVVGPLLIVTHYLEELLLAHLPSSPSSYKNRRPAGIHWTPLARHHDLAARPLDWTLNPLVALYSAVEPRVGEEMPRGYGGTGELVSTRTSTTAATQPSMWT